MTWNILEDRPIYAQLIDIIEMKILNNTYTPGSKMTSIRDLSSEAKVNPLTMQRALNELEKKGLIAARRTAGNFITEDAVLIEQLKGKRAKSTCRDLSQTLKELGLSKSETIKIIEEEF